MVKNLAGATLVLIATTLVVAGCGLSGQNTSAPSPSTRIPVYKKTKKAVSASLATLNPAWIMPNRLPVSAHTKWERINWPIYNTQLAMNQFPASWHGNDLINSWKLPPNWVPYLMKNETPAKPRSVNGPDPLTLYITLQGTVFLYPQTISGSQWPGTLTVGDVPPTTIVAEFVPLKLAVEAGIIPESSGSPKSPPQPASGGPVFPIWQKVLGMTAMQISQSIYGKNSVP